MSDKKFTADAKDVIARVKQQKRARLAAEKAALKAKAEKAKQTVKRVTANGKKADKTKNTVKENRLEMLVTIVNRNKAEYYIDLMHAFDINIQLVVLGHGTADASTLAYFGATDSDKAVIIGVVQENNIKDLMDTLEEKFNKIKNGKGIAYTVPLSGVIGKLIFGFLSNNRMTVKDNTESKVKDTEKKK